MTTKTDEYAQFNVRYSGLTPRSQKFYVLRCHVCGATTTAYLWSWAGHGFKRCSGCNRKFSYLGTRGHIGT